MKMDRRTFTQTIALGLGALSVPAWAQARRNVKIGHTGITWPGGRIAGAGRGRGQAAAAPASGAAPAQGRAGGDPGLAPAPATPPAVDPAAIETIFKDVSSLGFYGLELVSWQIEGME